MEIRFFDGTDNLSDALWVRDEVFTKEQGFTIPTRTSSTRCRGTWSSTGRAGPPPPDGSTATRTARPSTSGASRCARAFRGEQFGRLLMERLEAAARERGAKKIVVGAQLYAIPFYEKCGYRPTGERFFEEFCEHETLVKEFS